MQAVSKPTKITFNREWNGPSGTIYYFDIEFEDGTVGQFGTTKREQNKFFIGTEITYSKEEKQNQRGSYFKIDKVNIDGGGGGSYGSRKSDPKTERSIVANVALECAMSVIHKMKLESSVTKDLSSVFSLSNKFYDFIQSECGTDKQKRITMQARLKGVVEHLVTIEGLEIKSSDHILDYVRKTYTYVETKMNSESQQTLQ
jgi:hypothetical protein